MSTKSTMGITKDDALKEIMCRLLKATDEQLENALEALVGESTLHNFVIVPGYEDWRTKFPHTYRPGSLD